MFTIAKGLLNGAWALVAGWIFPSATSLLMFWLLVLPSVDDGGFEKALSGFIEEDGTLLLVAAAVVGWLLSTVSTRLYQVLEGYLVWPKAVKDALLRRQKHLHNRQVCKVDEARASGPVGCSRAVEELYRSYPPKDQMLPTRFGNRIRSFECYGQDRYKLDTVQMWPHLTSVAPESMTRQVGEARTQVDFFVCLLYTQLLVGASAVAAMLFGRQMIPELVAAAFVGFTMVGLSYKFAITATMGWADTVRAVVDVGRLPLAKALGLSVPEHIEDERRMWEAVAWWVGYPYQPQAAKGLDQFRIRTPVRNGMESDELTV